MVSFYKNKIESENGVERINCAIDENIIGVEEFIGTYHYDSDDILVTTLNGKIFFRKYFKFEEDNIYYACLIDFIDKDLLKEEAKEDVDSNTSFEILNESEYYKLKNLSQNTNTRTNLLLEMESIRLQLSECKKSLYEERRKRILSMARQYIQ